MGVKTQIERIQENISNAYNELEKKGAEMPSSLVSDNLANTISSIPEAIVTDDGNGNLTFKNVTVIVNEE